MKFKSLILVLTIAFSVIFISMLGSSYAYYVATGGTTLNVVTGDLDKGAAIVFEQSEYINVTTGIPLAEEDVTAFANKSVFKLMPNKDILKDYDAAINVSIINLAIDDALKVDDFKYSLVCNDGASEIQLNSGTGKDFTSQVLDQGFLVLGSLSTESTGSNKLDVNKTYTCTFRTWLLETGENQNALMGKSFSGLIKVNTLFRGQ